MKEIIESLAAIAQRDLPKCKCGGKGFNYGGCKHECGSHNMHSDRCSIDVCSYVKPRTDCPDCAELRKVASMHVHEYGGHPSRLRTLCSAKCKTCGKDYETDENNPTLTIQEVANLMKTVGVWEKFLDMVLERLILGVKHYPNPEYELARILTSPEFYPVAAEFLRKEVKNV